MEESWIRWTVATLQRNKHQPISCTDLHTVLDPPPPLIFCFGTLLLWKHFKYCIYIGRAKWHSIGCEQNLKLSCWLQPRGLFVQCEYQTTQRNRKGGEKVYPLVAVDWAFPNFVSAVHWILMNCTGASVVGAGNRTMYPRTEVSLLYWKQMIGWPLKSMNCNCALSNINLWFNIQSPQRQLFDRCSCRVCI